LLTTLQLTLLARSKYVSSVLQLEREERFRERLQSELSVSNILLGGGKGFESLMAGDMSNIVDSREDAEEADFINEESESKYLTLSWWLLHVGWKDVGERVRKGVEEVFYGYAVF
jgi:peroxin-3